MRIMVETLVGKWGMMTEFVERGLGISKPHPLETKLERIEDVRIGPLKIKLQLFCGDEIAMGPGKADLLAAIEQHQSISAAGRALGMSYRRTWLLVDEMNRCYAEKLVETRTGGGRDRGARVTPIGLDILEAYRSLEAEAARLSKSTALDRLSNALLNQPRQAKSPDDQSG
jgi:molybdate transport system regulatory protein